MLSNAVCVPLRRPAATQVFAVSNCISTLPGVLAPLVVEALVDSPLGSVSGFRVAFALIGFGCGLPALLFFVCCFEAEPMALALMPQSDEGGSSVLPSETLALPPALLSNSAAAATVAPERDSERSAN